MKIGITTVTGGIIRRVRISKEMVFLLLKLKRASANAANEPVKTVIIVETNTTTILFMVNLKNPARFKNNHDLNDGLFKTLGVTLEASSGALIETRNSQISGPTKKQIASISIK
jgi:hypothetical protein